MSSALRAEYEELRRWLFEVSLPLWAKSGVDRGCGGFFEKIDHTGRPTNDPRRTRLVCRQIISFAVAADLGWSGPADEIVVHGLRFFRERCVSPEGPVYSVVSVDGPPPTPGFDLYDHAFALLCLATAAGRGHEPEMCTRMAIGIRDAMIAGWKHPWSGFEESNPPAEPLRSNPHMHLFEAALEWVETDPGNVAWQSLADEIAELCLEKFRHPLTGAIGEFYNSGWDAASGAAGRLVEPGHQFEWAWLLVRWGQLRERHDAIDAARALIELAEHHGVDRDGLVVNSLKNDLLILDGDRRLWPQAERIKAQLSLTKLFATQAQRNQAIASAAKAVTGLRRYFQTRVPGLWIETLRADGSVVDEPARGSSLYHISCAFRELHQYFFPESE